LLGINEATSRNWVEDRYGGVGRLASGSGEPKYVELAMLGKEHAELRRANEILKIASAFFAAAEIDRRLR
jgi:transposase